MSIETTLIESSRWQAVGLVLDQNARDALAHRYDLLQEVVSWFKGIDLFRRAESELMLQQKPRPDDRRYHKAWLVRLIAEGERLLTEIRGRGGLSRNKAGIRVSDVEATVEELYDTQAEWYGPMKPESRAALLRQLFNAS